jgi:hypothetical protein
MWCLIALPIFEVHPINDPVKLGWEALVKIEHYHVPASKILNAEK